MGQLSSLLTQKIKALNLNPDSLSNQELVNLLENEIVRSQDTNEYFKLKIPPDGTGLFIAGPNRKLTVVPALHAVSLAGYPCTRSRTDIAFTDIAADDSEKHTVVVTLKHLLDDYDWVDPLTKLVVFGKRYV